MRLTEQLDGKSKGRKRGYHWFVKRQKARIERRRANRDPECTPAYGRYSGYET